MRKIFPIVAILLAITVFSGLFVLHKSNQAMNQVSQNSEAVLFTLSPGTSLYQLMAQFDQLALYKQSDWLKLALKLQSNVATIKAGTYEISPQTPLPELLQKIYQGEEKQFSITLIEGLTFKQWLAQINEHPNLIEPVSEAQVKQWIADNQLTGNSAEGWLMPDTYAFTHGTRAIEILQRAHDALHERLTEFWDSRYPGLPYENAYEALIMASIIEKETGVAHERSHIAGVFVNRLNLNMRLQTDPTVIYGIGEAFDGNITRKHLRTPTPYNTYVIKGLPPTPIAMASEAALEAAFNPMMTEDLYFVSKGDGTHFFSATLEQHNEAVRQYQLKK
ncbi:endolytic transglycosylase MltG [Alteromonas facilis]|uniref:endolytic transglycosylase MltG n=1 Tax=Alteromonas facilis TaxID=2048004 RepID=UPI000C2924EA|nr:endolytic transglycosylase MltG [Alteromonas facilis]